MSSALYSGKGIAIGIFVKFQSFKLYSQKKTVQINHSIYAYIVKDFCKVFVKEEGRACHKEIGHVTSVPTE